MACGNAVRGDSISFILNIVLSEPPEPLQELDSASDSASEEELTPALVRLG